MSLSGLIKETVAGRNWVFVADVHGRYQRLRKRIGWLLIAVLLITPWVRINGLPAVLFDIRHRKFVLFGTIFWPQDVWLLFFLGVAAGVSLFLFTAWAGRVWCGYACPQSVFTEQIFLRIERWLEGSANQRRKIARSPKTPAVIARKIIKHGLFLAVSSVVAHTFVAYFMGAHELVYALFHPSRSYSAAMIFTTVFTVLFYFDFAVLREWVCNYMCPYARFQAALLDEDSLVVGYDAKRGEPRGRKSDPNAGDCIDCRKCVAVCPQGIDIRDGLQLECIHCARCLDACDAVMEKIGRSPGLIRYGSERDFAGEKVRFWRPRTIVYLLVLAAVLGGFAAAASSRRGVEATLLRQRGAPWLQRDDGTVINRFSLQIVNKTSVPKYLFISSRGLDGMRIAGLPNPAAVAPQAVQEFNLFIIADGAAAHGDPVSFGLSITTSEEERPIHLHGTVLRPVAP